MRGCLHSCTEYPLALKFSPIWKIILFFCEPNQLSFKDLKKNYNFAEDLLLQLLRLELKSELHQACYDA
jgi:hypothetical protein